MSIAFYETTFTDNVSVTIDFVDSGSGLGSSSQAFCGVDYAAYRGVFSAMNVETRMPDVVGYTPATSAVPEPSVFALWLNGLLVVPAMRRRR